MTIRKESKAKLVRKLAVLAFALVLGGTLFWQFGDRLSFDYLAAREASLRELYDSYPVIVTLAAIGIYVAVTGLSLPGATVLTLACGWYFGFWQGLVIVSFESTGGATLAFLLTRYLFGGWVQEKLSARFETINAAFNREGPFYLFTLRLIPVVPFFVINAVMGLTKIRTGTFWWVSQLGMLPGTAAYVYAGSTVPSLQVLAAEGVGEILSWQLLLAFAVIGLLPIVIRRFVSFIRHYRCDACEPEAAAQQFTR